MFVTHSFKSGDQKGKHVLLSTMHILSIQAHTLPEMEPDKQHSEVLAMEVLFGSSTDFRFFIMITRGAASRWNPYS